jgi:hypothetical protein
MPLDTFSYAKRYVKSQAYQNKIHEIYVELGPNTVTPFEYLVENRVAGVWCLSPQVLHLNVDIVDPGEISIK